MVLSETTHEHESMQIMHILHKLIISTNMMVEGVKQECTFYFM